MAHMTALTEIHNRSARFGRLWDERHVTLRNNCCPGGMSCGQAGRPLADAMLSVRRRRPAPAPLMPMLSQRANAASILSLRTGLAGMVDLIKSPMVHKTLPKAKILR